MGKAKRVSRKKVTWGLLAAFFVIAGFLLLIFFVKQSALAAPGLTYTVTNTGDNGGVNPAVGAGTGTLRQAIVDANANASAAGDPNKIVFNIAGAGVKTINLSAVLPGITTPTIVDGTTQPGASCGTLVPNDANGAITNVGRSAHTLLIEVNAGSVPTSATTATMNTASAATGSTIKGLAIYGVAQTNYSQLTVNSPNTTVTCNYLGVKADGATAPVKTPVTIGLTATATANYLSVTNNVISGTTQNYISTNGNTGSTIANNLIGTDATGLASAQNAGNVSAANGLLTSSITNYDIKNNVLANATNRLLSISTATTSQVRGNYFGIGIDGKTTTGFTASGSGIAGNYGKGLTIGGPNTADRNYAGGMTGIGFGINNLSTTGQVTYQNNSIGLGADGTTATPNTGAGISSSNTIGSIIKGNTVVNNGSTGITVTSDNGSTIQGNYIGITPNGTPMKNKTSGITIAGTATNVLIGGTTAGQGNYISGNNTAVSDAGININSTTGVNGVTIQGNYIGVKPDGVTAAPNGYGIQIAGASNGPVNITIGGNTAGARNIISGNITAGINGTALTTSTSNYLIAGNYIGLDKNGNTLTGAAGRGIQLTNPNGIQIGGDSTAGYSNVISGNPSDAIAFSGTAGTGQNFKIWGNLIGTKPDGVTAANNGGYGVNSYATVMNGSVQIGGSGTGQGNVIVNSNNTWGVMVLNASAAANPVQIRGNFIGILKDGTAAGHLSGGLFVSASNGVQVGGTSAGDGNIISGNNTLGTSPGLRIDGSTNITVQGNTIGLGPNGVTKVANGFGMLFGGAASTNVTIGGSTAGARNIISGNTTYGISTVGATFSSTSNFVIQGNYIGLDKNGDAVTGATGTGLILGAVSGTLIGGASAGQGNVISGNPGVGLSFSGVIGQNVQVYGNIIGLKPDGETAAGNATGINAATNNSPTGSLLIGGASAGQGNIISGNTGNGISLTTSSMTTNTTAIKGNKIGVSASGAARGNGANGISSTSVTGLIVGGIGAGEGNTIANNVSNGVTVDSASSRVIVRGNSIVANGKVGIDLRGSANAPDANDLPSALDADTGGNSLQNFPQRTTLTKCDASTEQATYLWSAANTTYTVDFYANPSGRDATGYGEGEQYVSSTTVTTSAAGYASITPPAGVTNLSMTATDPNGNTSEFSNERPVSISGCTVTAKSTSDTTPSLAGTTTLTGFVAGAIPTTAALTINGQNVNASIASPNWILADNTLTVLPAGSYNVDVSVTDPVSKLSTSYTATNALTIDTTSPTVTVNQSSSQPDPANVDSASFDIVFSEDVSTLAVADVTLAGTSGTITTLTKVDNKTYTAIVTGMTDGDTATMTLAAAKVTDAAGNGNVASTSTDNQVKYDTTKPTVTINQAAGQADPTNVDSVAFS